MSGDLKEPVQKRPNAEAEAVKDKKPAPSYDVQTDEATARLPLAPDGVVRAQGRP